MHRDISFCQPMLPHWGNLKQLLNHSTQTISQFRLVLPNYLKKMPFEQKEFTVPPPHPAPGTPPYAADAKPWYSVATGIWELLLNGEAEHKAVLQWWEPNVATANKPITHTFIEEVCFLKGQLKDLRLGASWGVGAYAYRKPGMEHGPYVSSDEGCLMFVRVVPASAGVD
jgi:hypothetical protein